MLFQQTSYEQEKDRVRFERKEPDLYKKHQKTIYTDDYQTNTI